jgi:hypothetical protein
VFHFAKALCHTFFGVSTPRGGWSRVLGVDSVGQGCCFEGEGEEFYGW